MNWTKAKLRSGPDQPAGLGAGSPGADWSSTTVCDALRGPHIPPTSELDPPLAAQGGRGEASTGCEASSKKTEGNSTARNRA